MISSGDRVVGLKENGADERSFDVHAPGPKYGTVEDVDDPSASATVGWDDGEYLEYELSRLRPLTRDERVCELMFYKGYRILAEMVVDLQDELIALKGVR